MPTSVVERVENELSQDLRDGTWERNYGALRNLDEYDAGLRLIVAELTREAVIRRRRDRSIAA